MGTEVLRPQDCLTGRIGVSPVSFSRRRYGNAYPHPSNHSNARCHRKPVRSEQRKRYGSSQSEPSISRRSQSPDNSKSPRKNLVMENVRILRRGEPLDRKAKNDESSKEDGGLIVMGTGRLGPGPEMVPTDIRIVDANTPMTRKADVYAGSGFYVSPAPSSLPLPSFSKKKQVAVDDSATRDLCRLLRLDL